ncbi:hypothetical protein [Tuberibacillus sp. Marseille-P3662]|uniref:hypothetical protein n=1 Tax=Tuberibacillus sp. Marseille-P3662 TaxID=1965358 RepID=UPI000A1CA45C|nr:hypothetical protein [Tuberibacillus sp. Marseille-P3662]
MEQPKRGDFYKRKIDGIVFTVVDVSYSIDNLTTLKSFRTPERIAITQNQLDQEFTREKGPLE